MITQLKIDVQFKTPFATEDEFDIFLDSFLEYIESNEVLFGGGSDVSYIDGVVHSETKTAIVASLAGVPPAEARRRLAEHGGVVRKALELKISSLRKTNP